MSAEIVNLLGQNTALFLVLIGVAGLCVGSFINVVIYRVPIMLERHWSTQMALANDHNVSVGDVNFNLYEPRSHCPHCDEPIPNRYNIPIIGYFLLKGRSACCQQDISLRYPVTEFVSMTLSIAIAYQFGFTLQTLAALFLAWSFVSLFFIDIDHYMLPDNITLPMIWLGLGVNTFSIFCSPTSAIIGAICGYTTLWLFAYLFKKVRKVDGMGHGDFKLLALCGAWLGWQLLPMIILVSSLTGSLFGIAYCLLGKHSHRDPIPFGPFLILGALVALFWGNDLLALYFNVLYSGY